jgi:hypothetical protein
MTTKQKICFFIPFAIVVSLLLYCWFMLLFDEYSVPHITNYMGLIFFIPVLYFLYTDKSYKKPLVVLGIYLCLATCKLANIFPYTHFSRHWLSIGALNIPLPDLNGWAFLILLLYGVLNFNILIEMYLDHKESKGKL